MTDDIIILMSNELKLHIVTIVGFIIGMLETTGHLDAATGNSLVQDANAWGGIIVSAISLFYECEHLFFQSKKDSEQAMSELSKPLSVGQG